MKHPVTVNNFPLGPAEIIEAEMNISRGYLYKDRRKTVVKESAPVPVSFPNIKVRIFLSP
jgi:hypothetical protein